MENERIAAQSGVAVDLPISDDVIGFRAQEWQLNAPVAYFGVHIVVAVPVRIRVHACEKVKKKEERYAF